MGDDGDPQSSSAQGTASGSVARRLPLTLAPADPPAGTLLRNARWPSAAVLEPGPTSSLGSGIGAHTTCTRHATAHTRSMGTRFSHGTGEHPTNKAPQSASHGAGRCALGSSRPSGMEPKHQRGKGTSPGDTGVAEQSLWAGHGGQFPVSGECPPPLAHGALWVQPSLLPRHSAG